MRRLSICYAAPGHALVGTAGSTRNILSVARELAQCGDVTVAFRTVVDDVATDAFRVTSIVKGVPASMRPDDVAAVGLQPRAHLSYLRCLRRFARRTAGGCDLY